MFVLFSLLLSLRLLLLLLLFLLYAHSFSHLLHYSRSTAIREAADIRKEPVSNAVRTNV
jgi:hypothetical protein